jgi:hypothetical protein
MILKESMFKSLEEALLQYCFMTEDEHKQVLGSLARITINRCGSPQAKERLREFQAKQAAREQPEQANIPTVEPRAVLKIVPPTRDQWGELGAVCEVPPSIALCDNEEMTPPVVPPLGP